MPKTVRWAAAAYWREHHGALHHATATALIGEDFTIEDEHVDPRSDGRGRLMRLARETRFSGDKTPYKTKQYAASLAQPHARAMDFTGRPMVGMVRVAADGVASDELLEQWIQRGIAFVSSLPPK